MEKLTPAPWTAAGKSVFHGSLKVCECYTAEDAAKIALLRNTEHEEGAALDIPDDGQWDDINPR